MSVLAVLAVLSVCAVMTVLAIFAVNSDLAVFAFDDVYIDLTIAVGIFYVQHSVFYLDIGNTAAVVAVFVVFAFKLRYPLLQSALKAPAFRALWSSG